MIGAQRANKIGNGAHRSIMPMHKARTERLDFAAVNAAALRELPSLLLRWLPNGRSEGHEYVARTRFQRAKARTELRAVVG
jgi:hypothetical protein